MIDCDPLHYQWRVTDRDHRGRLRTYLLGVGMTKAAAMDWSAANVGQVLELVPGSGAVPEPRVYSLRPSGGAMKTPGFGD